MYARAVWRISYGFMPGFMRVPWDSPGALSMTMVHVGPLTATARDAALAYAVMAPNQPGHFHTEIYGGHGPAEAASTTQHHPVTTTSCEICPMGHGRVVPVRMMLWQVRWLRQCTTWRPIRRRPMRLEERPTLRAGCAAQSMIEVAL